MPSFFPEKAMKHRWTVLETGESFEVDEPEADAPPANPTAAIAFLRGALEGRPGALIEVPPELQSQAFSRTQWRALRAAWLWKMAQALVTEDEVRQIIAMTPPG
jgi:hypothetical protein